MIFSWQGFFIMVSTTGIKTFGFQPAVELTSGSPELMKVDDGKLLTIGRF
jgi:hypothetical protein